jgi:hypothetical protein
VRRSILFSILLLVTNSASLAEKPEPPCVLDPARMPASWQAPAEVSKGLHPAPWSQGEAKDAKYAIGVGLDEMIAYFKQKHSAVKELWDDSIEALIQLTYSSANRPAFDAKARKAARQNLATLIEPFIELDPKSATCTEFDSLLPIALFALFAHKLYPPGNTRTAVVTKRTNAAYRACGSFEAATEDYLHAILAGEEEPADNLEDLFDLYIWTLWLIEAELYPDIALPAEARAFAPKVWKYFRTYRLPDASDFKDGARDQMFIKIADLATHIAHIPTGVHRFPLYVSDSPSLYRFHRENFYPVMQSGQRDLLASFVDTLRQYGCTAEDDVQVRDGTRLLLKVFHDGGDRWMNKQPDGVTGNVADYRLIHKPWTRTLGIRPRQWEQPRPGTYGGTVRRWLPGPL